MLSNNCLCCLRALLALLAMLVTLRTSNKLLEAFSKTLFFFSDKSFLVLCFIALLIASRLLRGTLIALLIALHVVAQHVVVARKAKDSLATRIFCFACGRRGILPFVGRKLWRFKESLSLEVIFFVFWFCF